MINHKNGDLLNSDADIICQQVNCCGVMGSGLAKHIKDSYPDVYTSYKIFCQDKDPLELLGQVNWSAVPRDGDMVSFANIFGQLDYGNGGTQYTDYTALEKGLLTVYEVAKKHNLKVALPHAIGCGLGGGDWEVVLGIISRIFQDEIECEIWKLE